MLPTLISLPLNYSFYGITEVKFKARIALVSTRTSRIALS